MKQIIDLTHNLFHKMPVFPGDPTLTISNAHLYENGYFVNLISMGTHTGTHVDAPIHRIEGKKSLTDIPVTHYIGWKTYILDATHVIQSQSITLADCEKHTNFIKNCDAVIFKTNWSKHINSDIFFDEFPGIDINVVNWLYENNIRLIGLETPSVNAQQHLEVHNALLEKEICIVESLTNVDQIPVSYVEFHAAPLKLEGLDGSPVRAYAIF